MAHQPAGHPDVRGEVKGECPLHKLPWGRRAPAKADAVAADPATPAVSKAGGGCPVQDDSSRERYLNPTSYDVYGRRIDPRNQMPANPNNQPAPGQSAALSTERVSSSIPKGGSESTWSYPSPQMFWNSLVRKGKAEGATEADMDVVVAIHNNMNEVTWRRVLEWEQLGQSPVFPTTDASSGGSSSGDKSPDGREPRLLRFRGRPHDLSPKAWFKTRILGCPEPFDRHDWVVDRGGEEIRYVIDYYHDERAAAEAERQSPALSQQPTQSVKERSTIGMDVRPALDTPTAAYLRFVAMPLARALGNTSFAPVPIHQPPPPPLGPAGQPDPSAAGLAARLRSWLSADRATAAAAPPTSAAEAATAAAAAAAASPRQSELASLTVRLQEECKPRLKALQDCASEEECGAAAVALTRCMAGVACPAEARRFDGATRMVAATAATSAQGSEALENAFAAMQRCLQAVEEEARKGSRSSRQS